MLIYVNDNWEIKDVNSNSLNDPSLTEVEVTDGTFDNWSIPRICCYKVQVSNGHVMMMTPYIDSRLIEHIDQLGREVEKVTPTTYTQNAYIGDIECIFNDVKQGNTSVFFESEDIHNPAYTMERYGTTVAIYFENELEYVTTVTLSIV